MISPKDLKSFPVFVDFKRGELEEIIKNSFEKTLKKDEKLFVVDQRRDVFYIVIEGEISILRALGEAIQSVEIITVGEYIAEHALFDPKLTHRHTAIAHSDMSRVLGIPGKHFQKLSQQTRYKLLHNLLPLISDNFSHASNRIMTIFQIGQVLGNVTLIVDALGEQILKILLTAIQAEKAFIALKKSSAEQALVRASYGFNPNMLGRTIHLKDDKILQEVFSNGKQVNLSQKEYLLGSKKTDYITASVLATPLQAEGQTIGALVLIDKKEGVGFNVNNEALLNIVSKMIALAIQQAQHIETREAELELRRQYISM